MMSTRTNFLPPMTLRSARTVLSFALLGAVAFGAFLSWLPIGFDIHIPGTILGAAVGVFALRT